MEENKDYNPSQYEDDDRMEAPKSAKSIRGYQTIIVILAVILFGEKVSLVHACAIAMIAAGGLILAIW